LVELAWNDPLATQSADSVTYACPHGPDSYIPETTWRQVRAQAGIW